MINSLKDIKHKGLRDFLHNGSKKGLPEKDIAKIRNILFILSTVSSLNDFNQFPNYKLHPLKGDLADYWSVNITSNYRIIFKFKDIYFYDIDYVDYH